MIKKTLTSLLTLLLTLILCLTSVTGSVSAADLVPETSITSTNMSIENAKSNLEEYYSNDDWSVNYPDGLFIVEYSSYEINEGGTDANNPEDCYLGITVYRLGGNSQGSNVTYSLSLISGDSENYPDCQGSITFEPQQEAAVAKIKVINDDIRNGDQLLLFSLESCTTGVVSTTSNAVIKIYDDEPFTASLIDMSIDKTVTDMQDGHVKVLLSRDDDATDVCTLKIKTADATAKAGVDFESVEETVIFNIGETEKEICIPLIQSDNRFTDPKTFSIQIYDMKACEPKNISELSVNITNKLPEDKTLLTEVDAKSDLSVDDSGTLADSSVSIVNVNDNVDRAKLLLSAVGAANGKVAANSTASGLVTTKSSSKVWSNYLELDGSDFEMLFSSDKSDKWNNKTYNNGNEDFLLASKEVFNLNHFSSVNFKFVNIEKLANGNPNTAFGYMLAGGASDSNKNTGFVKTSLSNASSSDLSKMKAIDRYFLYNANNKNVDASKNGVGVSLKDENGNRWIYSKGKEASNMKMFVMLYDDEGWDDHNFSFESFSLERAYLACEYLNSDKYQDFKIEYNSKSPADSKITYTYNNYKWTITISDGNGGFVSLGDDKYGIYLGSTLKITATTDLGGEDIPTPELICLTDSKGVIHNTASPKSTDGTLTFTIKLETLVNDLRKDLKDNYGMTDQEATDHITCLNSGDVICDGFSDILTFESRYTINQTVSVNFSNVPSLVAEKTGETREQHEQRVWSVLEDFIAFYHNNNSQPIPCKYNVDLNNNVLSYENSDYDYIVVSPQAVGSGYNVTSNVIGVDYESFGDTKKITSDYIHQTKGEIVFTIFPETAEYLIPGITTESFGVAQKVGNDFTNVYSATSLANYIPFEAMYQDTSESPSVYYYKAIISISDIYVAGMSGKPKDYVVDVNYSTTDGTENKRLFSFVFKGGTTLEDARNFEVYNYSDIFKKDKGFMPYVELLSTLNGYRYAIYIPSYYNYQSETDLNYQNYTTIFKGADGISLEIHNYDKNSDNLTENSGSDNGTAEVISSLSVNDTQYICTKIPDINFDSDSEEVQNEYFEEQEEFYTYNDNNVSLNLSGITVDTSAFFSALGKVYKTYSSNESTQGVGGQMLKFPALGAYIKLGNNSMTLGYKISYKGFNKVNTEFNPFNEEIPVAANGADTSAKDKVHGAAKKSNLSSAVSIMGGVDIQIQLLYDTHSHQYYFSSFTVSANVSVSVNKNVPIPALLDLVYGAFGLTISLKLNIGLKVVDSYVDKSGKTQTRVCWNGIDLTPDLAGSMGIGVGLSNLLAFEAGGAFDVNGTVRFGDEDYYPPQKQYDLYKGFKATGSENVTVETIGDTWNTINTTSYKQDESSESSTYSSGFYRNTLLQSISVGNSLVIQSEGTSFILKASKNPTGGCMAVTITTSGSNNVTKTKTEYVDLYTNSDSEDDYLPQIVFAWEAENYKSCENYDFTVTITHVSRDEYNTKTGSSTTGGISETGLDNIALDSFYIYNNDYSANNSRSVMSFTSFSLKINMYLKFVIVGFSINLEPAYMMINYSDATWTLTVGAVAWSKKFILDSSQDEEDATSVKALRTGNSDTADYFTLGEYAQNKEKSVLQSDISSSSKTKVINYNGDTYAFYTALIIDNDKSSNYQIYYSKNGIYCGLVAEMVFVNDFDAFITDDNRLAVVMTASDSTVTTVLRDENEEGGALKVTDSTDSISIGTTEDLSEALKRTAIYVTVYNNTLGAFDKPQIISETDSNNNYNNCQEYLPVAVSSENGCSVLLYVKDAESSLKADYKLNWKAYNDTDNTLTNTTDIIKNLMDSMYSGEARLMYSVMKDGEIKNTSEIPVDEVIKAKLKPGYKITSIDAVIQDSDTVAIAYSAEIPYSVLSGRTGTLKEIHYLTGKISDNGSIEFSKTVVVDSVFDYDESTSVVFENVDPEDIPPAYYNRDTDTFHNEIILNKVQLENAVLSQNGDVVDENSVKEPTLFYYTNSSINYVDYDNLCKAVEGANNNSETDAKVGVLYDGNLDDYVIAVSENGCIYLIYNNSVSAGNNYTDTLCVLEYNAEDSVWNKPRTLTQSDAFDQEAYDDREDTGAVYFENLSALITDDGNVAIALKSSYIPFDFSYGTTVDLLSSDDPNLYNYYDGKIIDENGNEVLGLVAPMLDTSSDKAKTDICYITFNDPVTDIDVSEFYLYNEVLTQGERIDLEYCIENVGDRTVDDINVSVYVTDKNNSFYDELVSCNLSGALLAGTNYQGTLDFDIDKNYSEGSILCMKITDAFGTNVYYDSYTESYLPNSKDTSDDSVKVYREFHNVAELGFYGANVTIDEDGIMDFTVAVENLGDKDVSDSIIVKCNAYDINENGEFINKRTMFTLSADKSELKSKGICYITDSMDVKNYLDGSSLYYDFQIVTSEPQYTVDNDSTNITICKEDPKVDIDAVTLESTGGITRAASYYSNAVRYVTLGQEINVTPLLVSSGYKLSDIRIYEIGSNCLSIQRNSADNTVKLKVVSLPENSEGMVRLVVAIKGTTIFKTFYLMISDSQTINFDKTVMSDGFDITAEEYVYADNFDLATTETDGSTLSFSFTGKKLRLYGNLLTNGGDFQLIATNSSGKEVINKTISTASEFNDYGMLLYMSDELDLDTYDVTIKAILGKNEKLSLDAAKCTLDLSDVDTTPYYYAESYIEELDAPLLSGRSRNARFTLDFSNTIKLADGVNVEDITLEFDEYEDGVATGNSVIFTGTEIIDGKTLVLCSQLTSKAGAVLTYRLSDSKLPDGMLLSDKGTAVNTAIPDYDKVSYELKESGIMSVTVSEDQTMPDGNVKKSVSVRFMTEPDISRLEGTKLLYNTENSDGTVSTIEFKFVSLGDDNKVAIYRADSLTLDKEELSKTFSFDKGIVLNENNYVLVTADGDYLENDLTTVISDKSQLDINYDKLKSDKAPLLQVSADYSGGSPLYTPLMYLCFDEAVDVSDVINNNSAYVVALETVTNINTAEKTENEIKLYLNSILLKDRLISFKALNAKTYDENEIVSFSLLSDKIQYADDSHVIYRKLDKIEINPVLTEAKKLTFNTDAYIISATPYLKDTVLKRNDNTLCADVSFSTVVDENTLVGTSLTATEHIEQYDNNTTNTLELQFVSVKTVEDEEGVHSIATYASSEDVSLEYEDVSKIFSVHFGLTTPEDKPILTADGKYEFANVILSSTLLKLNRTEAESAEFKLVSQGDKGYSLYLNVAFNDNIIQSFDANVYAVVNMQVGDSSSEIYMNFDNVHNNILSFVSASPVTIPAGEVAIFTTPVRFCDSDSAITDERGVGVSEYIENLDKLTVDATLRGKVSDAMLESNLISANEIELIAKIQFSENVSKKAFEASTVNVTQNLTYTDSTKANVKCVLSFDSISNDNTAIYKAIIEIPHNADTCTFVLGDSIDINNSLYSQDKFIILSTDLSDKDITLTLSKSTAEKTEILSTSGSGNVNGIEDTCILVTYSDDIFAENLSGITLNAQVSGIDGVENITYTASKTVNSNALLFTTDKIDAKYANILDITLNNAVLSIAEGSSLYCESGLSVSISVKDANSRFVCINGEEFSKPTDSTEPATETQVIESSTAKLTDSATVSSSAQATEGSTKPTGSDGDKGFLTTGQRGSIATCIILLLGATITILLLRRKQKVDLH